MLCDFPVAEGIFLQMLLIFTPVQRGFIQMLVIFSYSIFHLIEWNSPYILDIIGENTSWQIKKSMI
jgi:hypothetical protein